MRAHWPKPLGDDFKSHYGLDESDARLAQVKYDLVTQGRNLRREGNIPSSKKVKFVFKPANPVAPHDAEVLKIFGITDAPDPDLARWDDIMDRVDHPEGEVTIGVVGKYVGLPDAYKSLREALVHGGIANRVKVNIRWLDAEMFEHEDADLAAELEPLHAILVPGGFGERGSEGKIDRKSVV